MQKRCVNLEIGYAYAYTNYTSMCTKSSDCSSIYSLNPVNPGSNFVCAKTDINPFYGVASFDDFFHSMTVVFIIITMEGWTDYFTFVSKTFTDDIGINIVIIFLFFHLFIFMGGYYLMNLFLAVVWSKFSEIERLNRKTNTATKGSLADKILTYSEETNKTKEEEAENKLSEEQKIDLLREKFVFIEKDPSKIPISYKTINDIFLMESLTPKESYFLKKRIEVEAIRADEHFNREEKLVRDRVHNTARYSLAASVKGIDRGATILSASTVKPNDSSKSLGNIINTDPSSLTKKNTFAEKDNSTINKNFIKTIPRILIIQSCLDETIKKTWIEWGERVKKEDDPNEESSKTSKCDDLNEKPILDADKAIEDSKASFSVNSSRMSDQTENLEPKNNDDKYKNEFKKILANINNKGKELNYLEDYK